MIVKSFNFLIFWIRRNFKIKSWRFYEMICSVCHKYESYNVYLLFCMCLSPSTKDM
jgi:hypothetical protein